MTKALTQQEKELVRRALDARMERSADNFRRWLRGFRQATKHQESEALAAALDRTECVGAWFVRQGKHSDQE